jgi:hypothetical protein
MSIFNDSRREFDLREICGQCGHRNGLHSMFNKCPRVTPNGLIIRWEFAHTHFQSTKRYEEEEAA